MINPPHMRPPKPPRSWDQRFLTIAMHVAGWSKDRGTQVGCVAVRDRRILATGYNGLPAGVLDSEDRLESRDLKLALTVHAEMNAIAYAARTGVCLAGSTFYIWPIMACSQCATMLIQADVVKVIIPNFVEPQRWQDSFAQARQMFIEAGVAVARIPMQGPIDPAMENPEDAERDLLPFPT